MELRESLQVVWKHLWLIILATILVAGMTYGITIRMKPIYSATATLEIDLGSDPRNDPLGAATASQRLAATYVEQLTAPVLLRQVSAAVNVPLSPGQLNSMITAQQVRDTQLIDVVVESEDPVLASDIANNVAEVFIDQERGKQQARYQNGKHDLDQQIAALEASIETTQRAISSLGVLAGPGGSNAVRSVPNLNLSEFSLVELAQLQTHLSNDQTRYTILLTSAEDFRLAAARYSNNVALFSPAEPPHTPVRPRVMLNMLLGVISGLVLGGSAAFLVDYLDDSIQTSDSVAAALGISTLASIARIKHVRKPKDALVKADDRRVAAVEGYRTLRTNLEYSGLGNSHNCVLVTSARQAEGKSTTLCNLGTLMAQAGRHVILVDADLRAPSLHKLFDLNGASGLGTVLRQESTLQSSLQPTTIDNLWVLPCGPVQVNPAELLASPQLARVIYELKAMADIVLMDSPPLLAVSDASLLASKADGVVLVVDSRTARRRPLLQAKAALDRVGAHVLGAVLNRQPVNGTGYYYS
jgi:capsular exopolysaccharide synthesis family protein